MSFRNLELLKHYKTYKNNIVKEFYTPVLEQAVLYQRSVGFFSSTALIELTKGITGLVKNGGKIQFIVSPFLSPEDIEAIEKGYEKRAIVENALLREIKEPENYFQEERLNLLAHLIENGTLELKVAFTPPKKSSGMYHEKVGLVQDEEGNKIVFTGSLNETINAFYNNYESIVVFTSWQESKEYADEMQKDFDLLWSGEDKDLEIIDFPDVVKERIQVKKKETVNYDIDKEEQEVTKAEHVRGNPMIPEGFSLREYQVDAISAWREEGYFFFGGERISGIANRTDLSKAVRGLMRLDVLENAYTHLKTVVKGFEDEIDTAGDANAQRAKDSLLTYTQRQEALKVELDNYDKQVSYWLDKEKEYDAELAKSNIDKVKELAESRRKAQSALEGEVKRLERIQGELITDFNTRPYAYFGLPSIKASLEFLEKQNAKAGGVKESIPAMEQDAIDYLIHRGTCICGTRLDKGTIPYNLVMEVRRVLPPEHVGDAVRQYKVKSEGYLVYWHIDF